MDGTADEEIPLDPEEETIEETISEAETSIPIGLPPMYESGDDMDKATSYKMEATDLKNDGNYEAALEKYNLAITAAPPSALLLANRGDVLLRLGNYEASVRDCSAALEKNPDRYDL